MKDWLQETTTKTHFGLKPAPSYLVDVIDVGALVGPVAVTLLDPVLRQRC